MSMGRGGMGEIGMWPSTEEAWGDSIQKLEKISVKAQDSLTVGSRKDSGQRAKSKSRGPGTWSPDGMWSPPPDRDLDNSRPSTAESSRSGAFSPGKRKSDPAESYTIHEVSNLDTLAGIAIKYGVQVEDVKRLNSLMTDAAMFARKTLRIPPPKFETPHESPSGSTSTSRRPSSTGDSPFPPRPHPKKSMTPAMSSLRGYYGIASPEKRRAGRPKRNSDGEGMEMYTYHSNNASEDEQTGMPSPVSRRAYSESGQPKSRWGMDDDDHLWDDWANKTNTRRAGTSFSNHLPSNNSTVSSAAGGIDDLASIYGIGEEETDEAGAQSERANGFGAWSSSEIEEIDLRNDTAQDAKETLLDGPESRWRGLNGANIPADTLIASSSNGRGALPTRGPVPRIRTSGGGASARIPPPPSASNRSSAKAQVVGAPLRPLAGGPNVTEGLVAGLSKVKANIPDALMAKVRRSSSASSLAEDEGSGRVVSKGPSFGSVGDLLTGAVVKRKAAKD